MHTLEAHEVHARYGAIAAVRGVDLRCATGEILSIVGPNGAGKSTTLLAISGACPGRVTGQIRLGDEDLTACTPERRVRSGIALVPEGRRIFARMSVAENLLIARASRRTPADAVDALLASVYARFPVLEQFAKRPAGLLSGGQQQQLAIGRALMTAPIFLLLDEPSLGLSPKIVEEVFATIQQLREEGLGIVLVEQNAKRAAELADRTLVMRNGRIEGDGVAADDDELINTYLGGRPQGETV